MFQSEPLKIEPNDKWNAGRICTCLGKLRNYKTLKQTNKGNKINQTKNKILEGKRPMEILQIFSRSSIKLPIKKKKKNPNEAKLGKQMKFDF